MYALFEKHRALKLVSLAVGLLVLTYLAKPAISLYKSRSTKAEDMIGLYSFRSGHSLNIATLKSGRMVSGDYSTDFSYEYSLGTYSCKSADSLKSWTMRVVDSSNIYNNFDRTYLYRVEGAQ